jgi:hypothetical protein
MVEWTRSLDFMEIRKNPGKNREEIMLGDSLFRVMPMMHEFIKMNKKYGCDKAVDLLWSYNKKMVLDYLFERYEDD